MMTFLASDPAAARNNHNREEAKAAGLRRADKALP
jgi:hypothetical protein